MQGFILVLLARALGQARSQTLQGSNPYFAPYLRPGELPDGAVMPLFQEVWRIIGYQLTVPNFTAKVDQVSETIFAAYSFHGQATGSMASTAALTQLDGQLGVSQKLVKDCLTMCSLDGHIIT